MSLLDFIGMVATYAPGIAIVVILIRYSRLRAEWKRRKRLGLPNNGFCPSFKAMSLAVQSFELFYRPSIVHRLQEEEDESAEDDGSGEAESSKAHFDRQLRRIRRGEKVDTLVWRLE